MREINQVCHECGVTANVLTCLKKHKTPPKKLCYEVSTWSLDFYDICRQEKSVSSPRNYFHPDFSLLQKNWILKLKK